MRETQTREIDGESYEFMQLGAKRSFKILVKLTKILGEPIGVILGASIKGTKSGVTAKDLMSKKIPDDMPSRFFKALCEKLDEDEGLEIAEELIGGNAVLCNGTKIVFDLHYDGRIGHLFKVLWAALEVQYGNFFGAVTDLLASQAPPTKPAK